MERPQTSPGSPRRPAAAPPAPGPDGLAAVLRPWAAHPSRGVIFDFNGTLSNDEPLLLAVYTELFLRHLGWELTPAEYFARLAGRSDREIVQRAVAERGGDAALVEELMAARRERYRRLVEERSPIAPDTAALVGRLAQERVAMAIVTGAERRDVEFVLERSAIAGLIPVVIAEEDVSEGKPHPEGFRAGAGALGLSAGQLLVFEDSLPGVRAAKAAGLACVAVAGTHDAAALAAQADAVVPALGPGLLDGIPGPARRS